MKSWKVKNKIQQVMIGANIVSIIIMALVGYSYLINPSSHPKIGVLGLFFPFFALINILFIVFWFFVSRKRILISLVGMLVCIAPVRMYFPINMNFGKTDGAIKVMSYNVLSFAGPPENKLSKDDNALVNYLVDSDCDIICLQEAGTKQLSDGMKAKLQEKYPYNRTDLHGGPGGELAIYTKYKILSVDSIHHESKTCMTMVYELLVGKEIVYVINNHFQSTGLSPDDRAQFRNMMKGQLKQDEAESESRSVISKLAQSASLRARQAQDVATYIDELSGKNVIVCGDFNDNPISYTRHMIAKNLTDCFIASGNGFGWSFCHHAMRVRIDNIMCSDKFSPVKCEVDNKVHYSDHYPIVSWLKMDLNP